MTYVHNYIVPERPPQLTSWVVGNVKSGFANVVFSHDHVHDHVHDICSVSEKIQILCPSSNNLGQLTGRLPTNN